MSRSSQMNWTSVRERVISHMITVTLTLGILSCLSITMDRRGRFGEGVTTIRIGLR